MHPKMSLAIWGFMTVWISVYERKKHLALIGKSQIGKQNNIHIYSQRLLINSHEWIPH